MLEKIFVDKVDHDNRNEIILFRISNLDKAAALRLPSLWFWLQIAAVTAILQCVAIAFAYILYKVVIPYPKSQVAFLVGYGVIIPIIIYLPFALVEFFNINNIFLRFFTTTPKVLSLFRTTEAMYGFYPKESVLSMKSYITYFAALGDVRYDKDSKLPITPTLKSMIQKILTFVVSFFLLGLYSSILYHYDFGIFHTSVTMKTFDLSLLSYGHILNGVGIVALMQSMLFVYAFPLAILTNILNQTEVHDVMGNIWISTTLAEFWGKRWNILVHNTLKRGVFKPARTYFPSKIAVLCTFLVSGLFHEWIWYVLLLVYDYEKDEHGNCSNCYKRKIFGMQLLFFMWNGIYVALEFTLPPRFQIIPRLANKLHPFFRTPLLTMVLLPVFHWFYYDYLKSRFFHHMQMSLPTFVLIDL